MQKWGHSDYLSPAYRRGYVEVLRELDETEEEGTRRIPKDVLEFIQKNQDPDYVFEVDESRNSMDQMSFEGFKVLEMIIRYFWCTEEEREDYDQSVADSQRTRLINTQEYVQGRIDDYIKYDYRHRGGKSPADHRPLVFRGIPPARLKECPKGCTEVLAVLKTLIPNYVERIPKTYMWVMEMSKKKGYQYSFKLEEYDDHYFEEPPLSGEALEILADISYRYWRGFQVPREEIPVNLYLIEYE